MEAQSWLLAYKGRAKQGFLRALLPNLESLGCAVVGGTRHQWHTEKPCVHIAATLMILLRTRSGALYNVR